MVQISPTLCKEDIDWSIIGGIQGKNMLKQNIEIVRNIMVSVATGGNRIQEEDERYKKLNTLITTDCKKLNLTYNNLYSTLWDWFGKWKADFPTYQDRRTYISDLFATYSGRYPFSIPVIPVHFFVSKDRYLLRS